MEEIIRGILIPFLGTTLGATAVIFIKGTINNTLQRILIGLAAGIMTAASIWSLLLPAIASCTQMGKLAFLPAAAGFWFGILFLLILDKIIPHLHINSNEPEGPKSNLNKSSMMVLAVTLHNIPEGMAVGIMYAACLGDNSSVTLTGATVLSIGIAIQNIPEGAIISMPLAAQKMSRLKAFIYGTLSGVVEPIGAAAAIAATSFIVPLMPYFLGFAAGAMIYVVIEEMIPEMSSGKHSDIVTLMFSAGFTIMMALDCAFS